MAATALAHGTGKTKASEELGERPAKRLRRTLPLEGKVAVVTGAADGIGKHIALRFAREGAKVVVADINEEFGLAVVTEIESRGGTAMFQLTDVSDEEQVRACMDNTAEQYGKIDILINNATLFLFGHVGIPGTMGKNHNDKNVSVEEWTRILNVNVLGYAKSMEHAVRHMMKNEVEENFHEYEFGEGPCRMNVGSRGVIVNVGSVSSWTSQSQFVPYNATKAAILSMTRCSARDLAKHQIRVNQVSPGTVETRGSYGDMRNQNLSIEDGRKLFGAATALGRQGAPQEIASVAFFLATDESSFITGSNIVVDGGQTFK